jgi:mRNA interferase HigB
VQTGPRHQICFSPLQLSLLPEQPQFVARDGRLTTSRIVKYYQAVHIVTRKHLSEAMQEYPEAANEIKAWVAIVEGVRWHNFAEVRLVFRDADYIDGYGVFNIRRNRFRLITVIHYAKTTDEKRTDGHVYIRSFLTHKEYNDRRKWDRRFGTK